MKQYIRSAVILVIAGTMFCIPAKASEAAQSKTFKVTKGGSITISVSGDVTIIPWDKDEAVMKVEGIDQEDMKDLEMSQSGNTLTLSFESRYSHSSDLSFTVSLPKQFDVDIRTSGGNIEFEAELKGKVHIKTSGGNIALKNIDGPTTVKTAGGNIKAQDLSGQTSIKTSGGNIDLGALGADGDVVTSGGNIHVGKAVKSISVYTSGGEIAIGDVGGDIKAGTAGGNVEVGSIGGNASLKTSGGNISLGRGKGSVVAKTSGGNIKLEEVAGSVDAKTSGGYVQAVLTSGAHGKSSLASAGGWIEITLPADTKATIEARIDLRGSRNEERYDIKSDFEASEKKKEDHAIVGKYLLNGGGDVITLETSNSDIRIKKGTGK
jgi:DUF4097 and DUF4098 domain-containing protein YvlB